MRWARGLPPAPSRPSVEPNHPCRQTTVVARSGTTGTVSSVPTQLTIVGQASDNAGPFHTSLLDISNRPDTTASVAWAPAAWTVVGQAGLDQRTPNLAGIVQEITGRAAWASGNAMVFVITGTGRRTATSYNKSRTAGPKLVVSYHM